MERNAEMALRHWNERYVENAESWLNRPPRQMLVDWAHVLPERGVVLDAGAGVCVNAHFMVERGLSVIAMDFSEVALRLGVRSESNEKGNLEAVVCNMEQLDLPDDSLDVIVNFFFLERNSLRVYQRALKEGGVIFFETLLGMDEDKLTPEYYLQRGELLRAFTGFEIIHWDEGVPCGDKKFSEQLVARKQLEGRR